LSIYHSLRHLRIIDINSELHSSDGLASELRGECLPNSKSFTTFCITFSSRWMSASISRLLLASTSSRPPKHILNNCTVMKAGWRRWISFAPRVRRKRRIVDEGFQVGGRSEADVSGFRTGRGVCRNKGDPFYVCQHFQGLSEVCSALTLQVKVWYGTVKGVEARIAVVVESVEASQRDQNCLFLGN
jgi:hypothetical protein